MIYLSNEQFRCQDKRKTAPDHTYENDQQVFDGLKDILDHNMQVSSIDQKWLVELLDRALGVLGSQQLLLSLVLPHIRPWPQFPDLAGNVQKQGDSYLYSEGMLTYDPETEEAHDVVEPQYLDARKTIEAAGYVIDYQRSGCDHDSFWVYFQAAAAPPRRCALCDSPLPADYDHVTCEACIKAGKLL